MPLITTIDVGREVFVYLQSRQLLLQFKKAIEKIKTGNFNGLDFKKREPKSHNVWSLNDGNLFVYQIHDHQ